MARGPSDTALIGNLMDVLDLFRDLDSEMPVQTIMTFLLICQQEDISLREISRQLDMSQSAASRNIGVFTDWTWLKREGHRLIKFTPDPMDMRRKRISITAQGVKFRQRLLDTVGRKLR